MSPLTGKEWLHHRLCHRSLIETKTGSLVVPGQTRFTAWTHYLSPFSHRSLIQCKADNNLTWLHLHWQKCHIVILIWQRAVACWQAWKPLPATEGGGSLGRETAEGITSRPRCRTACTNNITHKSKERNRLTDSTRHVPEAPHTQSRHTARLASGPTHRASSSWQWAPWKDQSHARLGSKSQFNETQCKGPWNIQFELIAWKWLSAERGTSIHPKQRSHLHPLYWILLRVALLSHDYLREGVSSIGSRSGEGSEESSSASCFNCVEHSLLRLTQMRRLSEGADEHKYIIHPWATVREQKSCLITYHCMCTVKKCFFFSLF